MSLLTHSRLFLRLKNPLMKSKRGRKCRQTASWWEIGSFANYSHITIDSLVRIVAFGTAWTRFTPEETVSNRSLPAAIGMDGGPINISDGRRKCLPSTRVRGGSAGGFTSCPPVKVAFVFFVFLSGKLSRFSHVGNEWALVCPVCVFLFQQKNARVWWKWKGNWTEHDQKGKVHCSLRPNRSVQFARWRLLARQVRNELSFPSTKTRNGR